ncbi:MAG TPA: M1 family aminopeptidase [Chitinophagaceae bacterium]|nr:M1 family aminopeptidase [Chitinophagaceae bacterium]
MRKILLLATLLPHFLFAQEPPFRNETSLIAESERKAAEGRMESSSQGSAASGNFNVSHYRCEWQLDPAIRYIAGSVTTRFTMIHSDNTITFDKINQLMVDSVVYHGNKIGFQQLTNNSLQIQFPATIAAGTRDSVAVYYRGTPGDPGSFHQGAHAGVPVIWTLSEPYGARHWWPCKDDLVDKADSIDIYITHPIAYTASSNGIMMSRTPVGGNVLTHFKHRYPIATYLVAVAITNYVMNSDTIRVGPKVYPLISYAYPESAATFFGSETYTKTAFRVFTELFGEYPFASEKYGHTQFGWGGGMEHQTNSFMVNTSPTLSAHELAHQWFGNKVTCGSWQHIWLNEGFATYLTALFLEKAFPSFLPSYIQGWQTSVTAAPGGSVFVPDTTNSNRIFSSRLSYDKGGYVVHMLRWVLGDSAFFRGLRAYLDDPALRYNFAKTEDLQRNLEQVSGKDLSSFFQKWVYGEGYPNYQADWFQAGGSNWVSVKLNQTTSHPSVSFYDMPVALEFRNATQRVTHIVNHRYSGEVFSLNVGFAVDTVLIDPQLWILARTRATRRVSTELVPPDDLQVYPNPAPTDATVRLRNATGNRLSVQLFNAAGQLLWKREMSTGAGSNVEMRIPFYRFAKGVYILHIRDDKDLKVVHRLIH